MPASRPYDAPVVRTALGGAGFWRDVRVVATTGSTSADLVDLARAGAPEGTVVLADYQSAGRGRLGRGWHAPAGTSIAVSMLFRPATVQLDRWPWLPLLCGVAVVEAVTAEAGVPATLKWPNDVLVDGQKLAGLLAEMVPAAEGTGAVVVGLGLNVTVGSADLPPAATSLARCGAPETDRIALLAAVLTRVASRYMSWRDRGGDPVAPRAAYRSLCSTLGTEVRVLLPAGAELAGRAVDIDAAGRLVVSTAAGGRALSVGDVVHVRCR